ncbi:MAG TPA: hypothetical protein VGV89_07320 [Thermoplasmata archaeon]|nr:hypothetical protein [Thermoplasmata archaeon]
MNPPGALPIDAGLLARFRQAGTEIAWRPADAARRKTSRSGGTARIAHLNDEEARVELRLAERDSVLVVDSGPVGALVILLEADRRGATPALEALEAKADVGFPSGAIVAKWGSRSGAHSTLGVKDLVDVARYALR